MLDFSMIGLLDFLIVGLLDFLIKPFQRIEIRRYKRFVPTGLAVGGWLFDCWIIGWFNNLLTEMNSEENLN